VTSGIDCSSRKIRELFVVCLSFSAFIGRVLHFVYRIIAYFMTLSTSSTLGVCVLTKDFETVDFTVGLHKGFLCYSYLIEGNGWMDGAKS